MTANLCPRERKVGVKVTLLLRQDVHQPLLIRACHQLRLGRRGPHLLRLRRGHVDLGLGLHVIHSFLPALKLLDFWPCRRA